MCCIPNSVYQRVTMVTEPVFVVTAKGIGKHRQVVALETFFLDLVLLLLLCLYLKQVYNIWSTVV